jgi:hypothetical protein
MRGSHEEPRRSNKEAGSARRWKTPLIGVGELNTECRRLGYLKGLSDHVSFLLGLSDVTTFCVFCFEAVEEVLQRVGSISD